MTRLILISCIVLLCLGWQPQNVDANPIMIASKALSFAFEFYDQVQQIQSFLKPPTEDEQLSAVDVKTFAKLDDISDEIKNLKNDLFEKIGNLVDKTTHKSEKLFKRMSQIENEYNQFIKFIQKKDTLRSKSVINYFEKLISRGPKTLNERLVEMHNRFSVEDINNDSLLSIFTNKKNVELMCGKGQSPYQMINIIFKKIMVLDSMALAMKLYVYDQYGLNKTGNAAYYKEDKEYEINDFQERIEETSQRVQQAMLSAPREVWKCDPEVHQKGVTYSKLQEVFQTYINYEGDFYHSGCSKSCDWYENDHHQVCNTPQCLSLPVRKRCTGILRQCELLHDKLHYCLGSPNSDRRYGYVETGSGTAHGHMDYCDDTRLRAIEGNTKWFFYCDQCICTCESGFMDIDRYFSLKSEVADINKNKVVTGLRFKLKNNVFYIQIQQGVLGANGTIVPKTVSWKPINKINKSDVKYNSPHVYMVDWQHKTVRLDDLEPEEYDDQVSKVVTGVKFNQLENNDLQLQVQVMEFDFATGQLQGEPEWYSNDQTESELSLGQPDDPMRTKNHYEDSVSGEYVKFQRTDLKKDFGQYTVPFIDIQEVASHPPVALGGVGIFHKGAENSGGFLGLKIIQYYGIKHMI